MSRNWSKKIKSLISAALFCVVCIATATAAAAAQISIVSSSISKSSISPGGSLTSTVKLTSDANVSNLIVDIRVYNSANEMIVRKPFENIAISAGTPVTLSYLYQAAANLPLGAYNIRVGVWDQTTWFTYLYDSRETFNVVAPPRISIAGSSISKTSISPGETLTSTVKLTSDASVSNLIVDIRVYNSANAMVVRKPFENVSIAGGSTITLSYNYQAAATQPVGTYSIQVGVWDQTTWQTYLYESRESFNVAAQTPPPAPILTTTRNILPNPGFEYGATAWNRFWGGMSIDSTQARSGSNALKIAPNGGTDSTYWYAHLVPWQSYRVTAYGKQSVAGESGAFTVILKDASGATVFDQSVPVTSTTYQAYSIDFTVPSNVRSAKVQFYKGGGTGSMYIDDMEVVSTSNPPATTYAYPSAAPAGGLAHPFGSRTFSYAAGIRPTAVTQAEQDAVVKQLYNTWKTGLSTRCGHMMVRFSRENQWSTVSEGIGYGMLLSVLMAGHDPEARQIFDELFRFARSYPAFEQDPNLMSWAVKPDCTDGGAGWNAADGDLDMAMGLVMADKQWGSDGSINYMAEAVKTINALKLLNFNYTGISIAKGQLHRTSDDMLSHFRAFKKATGDTFWDTALVKSQEALEIGQSYSSAGLTPGWLMGYDNGNIRPSTGGLIEGSIEGEYEWNACRNPWRLGTDYVVSGDPRTKAILLGLMNFFKNATGGNPTNFQPGYRLDGTPLDTWGASPSFVGPASNGAMVDPSQQAFLNSLWSWNASHPATIYYDRELQLIPLIVVSGNWWQP